MHHCHLNIFLEIATEAALLLVWFYKLLGLDAITEKDVLEMVTEADKASEAVILDVLHRFPTIPSWQKNQAI